MASKQIGQQMSAPSDSPMCRVTCATCEFLLSPGLPGQGVAYS